MTLTRRQRRAADRKVGKRELTRKAQSIAGQIRELGEQGFSEATISRKLALPAAVVRLVLEPGEGGGGGLTGRRKCVTCAHPEREVIDRQLAAGASPTRLARHYRTSKDSMRRHALNHLGYLVELALKGEYHGSIVGVRSMTITSRIPAGNDDKC